MSFLTENLGLKILALFLAVAVYAHVYTEREQESSLRVPLRVSGLSRGLVLNESPPEAVELSVRGTGKQLLKLRMQDPVVVVSLNSARPGHIQRMLSPADVTLPVDTDVAVTQILEPTMVEFSVDTLVEREAEVRVTLIGDLNDNVSLGGPLKPDPDRVMVRGPSEVVKEIGTLATEPLDLGTLDASEERELLIASAPEGVEVVPSSIRVPISVVALVTRTFSPIRVRVSGLPAGRSVRVEPDTAWVVLSGPAPLVDSLLVESLEVRLDAGSLGAGRHLMAPEVELPRPEIRLLTVRPARFLVEIGGSPP